MHIKSQLFQKSDALMKFNLQHRFQNPKIYKKKNLIWLKETFFCKLILSLFIVCECSTKSIYRHYDFIDSDQNVKRNSHQFIKLMLVSLAYGDFRLSRKRPPWPSHWFLFGLGPLFIIFILYKLRLALTSYTRITLSIVTTISIPGLLFLKNIGYSERAFIDKSAIYL